MQQRHEIRLSQGVMTDPQSIAEYEHACPGMGPKILAEFFENTREQRMHRQKLQGMALEAQIRDNGNVFQLAARGQLLAGVLAAACLALSAWFASTGHPVLAGEVLTTTIVAVTSTFLYGRKKQSDERIATGKGTPGSSSAAQHGNSAAALPPKPEPDNKQ